MSYKSCLEAKVAARNRLQREAAARLPQITEAMRQLIGQKVTLATGEFSAKFKEFKKKFEIHTGGFRIYFSKRYPSTVRLEIYVSESYTRKQLGPNEMGTSSTSQSDSFYLGRTEDNTGTLKEVQDYSAYNSETFPDFTAQGVIDARREAARLKHEMHKEEYKYVYFGEYDNY